MTQLIRNADVGYRIDRLPDGYGFFGTPKPGDPSVTYKRLFGHPSRQFYDSAKRFSVHFRWLMSGQDSKCTCYLCDKGAALAIRPPKQRLPKPLPQIAAVRQRQPRDQFHSFGTDSGDVSDASGAAGRGRRAETQKKPSHAVDEEGTEDIFKYWIGQLKKHGGLRDEEIEERNSFDWQAERSREFIEDREIGAHIEPYITKLQMQHSFVPRIGELVLWCPFWPEDLDLVRNPQTGHFRFFSFEQRKWAGAPVWKGGVVSATPDSSGAPPDFADLVSKPSKHNAINNSGFRVETFPDPNDDLNKSFSKQYKYISLRQIRPLPHWQFLLKGIDLEKIDPSVKYALTCMNSVSLFERHMIKGEWPNAKVLCKGMFLGSELIAVGDAVRILPDEPLKTVLETGSPAEPARCEDILVIDSVRLNLHDIQDSHVSVDDSFLSTRSSITLVGHGYTLNPAHSFDTIRALHASIPEQHIKPPKPLNSETVKSAIPTVGAALYGPWYRLNEPTKRYEISFDRILGRLYEADAIRLWLGLAQYNSDKLSATQPGPDLSYDMHSIAAARKYATLTDARLDSPIMPYAKATYFWADTRVKALGLETLNGVEVGPHHSIRDLETLRSWRAILKILGGRYDQQDIKDSDLPKNRGRPAGTKVVDGQLVLADGSPAKKRNTKYSMVAAATSDLVQLDSMAEGSELEDTENDTGMLPNWAPAGADRDHSYGKQQGRSTISSAQPLSKTEIMQSVEDDEEHEDQDMHDADDTEDDEEDTQELIEELTQIPLARGGTEESEGGDYDPSSSKWQIMGGVSDDERRKSGSRGIKRPRF